MESSEPSHEEPAKPSDTSRLTDLNELAARISSGEAGPSLSMDDALEAMGHHGTHLQNPGLHSDGENEPNMDVVRQRAREIQAAKSAEHDNEPKV